MNSMRLRKPRLSIHVEVDHAFRAGQFCNEHAARDGRRVFLLRCGLYVMRSNSDRIESIRQILSLLSGRPFDRLPEKNRIVALLDLRRIERWIGEDLGAR